MIELVSLKLEYCEQVYEIAKSSLPEHWSFDGVKDVLRYPNNIYYVALNEDGRVDVMNAAWGQICDSDAITLSLTESHKTVKNLKKTGAFTVSLADAAHVKEADFFTWAAKEISAGAQLRLK